MSGAFGPVWIAAEGGLFKKYGLDAEVVYIRGATQTTAAFLSGEVQVGATGCGTSEGRRYSRYGAFA